MRPWKQAPQGDFLIGQCLAWNLRSTYASSVQGSIPIRLTVGGEPFGESPEAFETISECLHDAAREVGDGMLSVRVAYGATVLGSFPLGRLLNDPAGLADELMERVSALIEARG
jgi:hypothetical protein